MQRVETAWPSLHLYEWQDTCDTLHMWTQMVGKVRMALSPHVNHWWEVTLYVTSRGLTTSPIPYGEGAFQIDFDFIDHVLVIETSDGDVRRLALEARAVAHFYHDFMQALAALGILVKIWPMPVEVEHPVRFDLDHVHTAYDAGAVHRFFQILLHADSILKQFRARFAGKCSPVQFFWGSFDLAVTRFSGRRAPERIGADRITRDAYSHEVSSAGFWPGGGLVADTAFYSYAAPEPPGFKTAGVRPAAAYYSKSLSEFILMYDDARRSPSPRDAVFEFFESTYDAAATLADWDRQALELKI